MNDIDESIEARILVVSSRPLQAGAAADVAQTAAQALQLWRKRRHAKVYADMTSLADGSSGTRFCQALRKEDTQRATHVTLMCESVQALQIQWARLSGADALVLRELAVAGSEFRLDAAQSAAAEPKAMSGGRVPAASQLGSQSSTEVTQEVVDLLVSRLQTLARMGPARSIVVADAIDELRGQGRGTPPTTMDLVRRVATEIADPAYRQAFITSFHGAH